MDCCRSSKNWSWRSGYSWETCRYHDGKFSSPAEGVVASSLLSPPHQEGLNPQDVNVGEAVFKPRKPLVVMARHDGRQSGASPIERIGRSLREVVSVKLNIAVFKFEERVSVKGQPFQVNAPKIPVSIVLNLQSVFVEAAVSSNG